MAAIARHGLLFNRKSLPILQSNAIACDYATKAEKRKGVDRKVGPRIESSAKSLASKGFLRPQKAYTPPDDVKTKLNDIFHSILGTKDESVRLDDLTSRFRVFNACYQTFQHGIPNSLLYTIETVSDVRNLYTTPVISITPYENLKNLDLPPNLHVQYDYHRFHPETDTKFGGITAFPRSSTIVSGLKYKGKYKGHKQNEPLPFTT